MAKKEKIKIIDPSKLKVKHFLKIHHTCVGFPTEEDLLFELASTKQVLSGTEFDTNMCRYYLSFKLETGILEGLLNKLVDLEYIKKENDNFKLVKHPWE